MTIGLFPCSILDSGSRIISLTPQDGGRILQSTFGSLCLSFPSFSSGVVMNEPMLINPDGVLLPELAGRMKRARKTKPLWAKQVDTAQQVQTLEGTEQMAAGDFLCRGIHNEYWPQSSKRLDDRYNASEVVDDEGFRRFDPKQDITPVLAVQLDQAFSVQATWGRLTGKPGDYAVQSIENANDIWIVDKAIFQASYEMES